MLPRGMDREFNIITIAAGIFNVTAALVLVPRYTYIGMAWSVVVTEALVTLAQFALLARRVPDFLAWNPVQAAEGEAL